MCLTEIAENEYCHHKLDKNGAWHDDIVGTGCRDNVCVIPETVVAYCSTYVQEPRKEKKRKVYAVGRYNGSFCTQKQPEFKNL